jgi:hypothetical protein
LVNSHLSGDENYFCLIITRITEFGEDREILHELFNEIFSRKVSILVLWWQNNIYSLIRCKSDSMYLIKENIIRAHQFLENTYGENCFSSISSLKMGIKSIKECYKESNQAMDYLRLIGRSHIMSFSDLIKKADSQFEEEWNKQDAGEIVFTRVDLWTF